MKFLVISAFIFSFAAAAQAMDSVPALKAKVTALALENMTNETNQVQIRAELDALIAQITAQTPKVTEADWIKYSPGSWQQIWSDEFMPDAPGAPKRDLSQIYQVISANGWGYNFGVRRINPNQAVTFTLAAVASVSGNEQTTEITKAFMRSSELVSGEDVGAIANAIHGGTSADFVERNAGQFPRGPIGAKGILTILYIDDDLKIGTAPNVYSNKVELFIMQRTVAVR